MASNRFIGHDFLKVYGRPIRANEAVEVTSKSWPCPPPPEVDPEPTLVHYYFAFRTPWSEQNRAHDTTNKSSSSSYNISRKNFNTSLIKIYTGIMSCDSQLGAYTEKTVWV